MKHIITLSFLLISLIGMKAQYTKMNAMIRILEDKKGVQKDLKNISIENKRFVLIKNFEDHSERYFVQFKNNQVTFVEVKDNTKSEKPTSKIYTGDYVRNDNNIISVRCSTLEGHAIGVPLTKTFLLGQQKNYIYLTDIANKERWIDETHFGKK